MAGWCWKKEDLSCGKVEAVEIQESSGARLGDQELEEMLLHKYNGYLSSLRKEFLKKRKKGKLPKDTKIALLDWWNTHYRWPYPTIVVDVIWFFRFYPNYEWV
ncbi:Homeobox protein knotted-1-like 10 [Camellia lanceoleosa]|uniref:Homeobox protein knotted-1-like 10 n=1 Tax=Camellia lanceoleosa TaxID=1840588 RepID=A0ACC0FYM3_9ERIC|nr:Homeobox protein knotted-1-like 10 [Camellia lanceoleosa]